MDNLLEAFFDLVNFSATQEASKHSEDTIPFTVKADFARTALSTRSKMLEKMIHVWQRPRILFTSVLIITSWLIGQLLKCLLGRGHSKDSLASNPENNFSSVYYS